MTSEIPVQPYACPLPKTLSLGQEKWESVLTWCKLIVEKATEKSVDPTLIAALIWYESGGNPIAYSKSGAVGLMQVMPRDGLAADDMCINGLCFADRPTIEELQNPEFNVGYGIMLLTSWIQEQGSLRDGLRRYGPNNVGHSYADSILSIYEELNRHE